MSRYIDRQGPFPTKSIPRDEFGIEGGLVKMWTEVDTQGNIVANEHGFFVERDDYRGFRQKADFFGRTPCLTPAVESIIETDYMRRIDEIKARRKAHFAKLRSGTF